MQNGLRSLFCITFLLFYATALQSQIGCTAGTEYGFGAIGYLGSADIGIEAGSGIAPNFVFASSPGKDIFVLYFPYVLGVKAVINPSTGKDINYSFKIGVSYNSMIKLGFGGGINLYVSEKPQILLSGGAIIYPKAENELRKRINKDENMNISKNNFSAPLTLFQPFLSLSILFK
jgi:hypothetical protein